MDKENLQEDQVQNGEQESKKVDDSTTKENKSKSKKEKKIDIKKFEELEDKYNKLENSYQRILADFENHKRRTSIELLDSKVKGKSEVFEKLLDIVDNFDRSMQFDIQTEEFKKGMEMLHSMLNERLDSLGLKEVDSSGIMDPNKHQAVMVENHDDLEDDQIIEVLQKGYCVEEKVLRPAMVKVNKR